MRPFLFFLSAVVLQICLIGTPAAQASVSTLYFGGTILTMDEGRPQVEAVLVRGGRITLAGNLRKARQKAAGAAREVNLRGMTLMPGFFDAHSHVTMSAAKLAVVNADPPPAGPGDSIASIQKALRARLVVAPPAPDEWLVGWGYDNAMLKERRHPNRDDLDAVSNKLPIALVHFSSHQIVLNSVGLKKAGISEQSEAPPGGRIMRRTGSREPTGLLQENAMLPVIFPVLDRLISGGTDIQAGEAPAESALRRMDAALELYMRRGFTTVTEMAATPLSMAVLEEMARQRRLQVDVIAGALSKAYEVGQVSKLYSREYHNKLRVGGMKIVLDGGSPGRSAYLREPYHVQLPGEQNFRGYPHIADQGELNGLVKDNYGAGTPVYIHALGDAAVDQAIVALQNLRTQEVGSMPRTQLIHVQQLQEDQLDALPALNVGLTFQVAHNYYFGDFHREQIYGPARTARLNPARSALDRELSVSIHHDSPVHPIDQFTLIWAAVNRVTRSGVVIGDTQRITVMEALRASTIDAAYQFFEEANKGSIEEGKLADFIVLSANPLSVDPMKLRGIKVLQTIKEDKVVFRR